MAEKNQNGMQCSQFEAILAEALDGALDEQQLAGFRAHAASCPDCGPMFAFAQQGLGALRSLQEVEPPRHLVHNILAATTGVAPAKEKAAAGLPWSERLAGWTRPVFVPVLATLRQPRFALSFAMAFFSLSMVLTLAGVQVKDLRRVDLRPSSIQKSLVRGYYDTSASVVRYYENLRFVYELQSRVRDLRNATEPAQKPDEPRPAQPRPDSNTTQNPEQERNQNHSRDIDQVVIASRESMSKTIFVFRRDA